MTILLLNTGFYLFSVVLLLCIKIQTCFGCHE